MTQIKMAVYAALLAIFLSTTWGCYALNSANTTIKVIKDGCTAEYSSNKEQVGLEAEVCGGKVKVDKSGSSEAIAAGSIANQLELIRLLQTLVQQSQKAAPVK